MKIEERILKDIIDRTQSAFIHNRQNLDGILLTGKIVEDLKRRKKGVILKLDFQKAYDKVDWEFILNSIRLWELRTNFADGLKDA